jgi:hypothetical protein
VATHAEDAQERTATHFAAGLPFEECLHVFAAVGVDMGHLRAGGELTPLRIVVGYGGGPDANLPHGGRIRRRHRCTSWQG